MERTVRVFKSAKAAEEADKKYYRSLSPAERIQLLLILRGRLSPYSDELTRRFERVVELLSALNVHFLVVGAFAVAYHGYPRYTADIDLFVERSAENAERLVRAIHQFGFGDVGLTEDDFLNEDQIIQLGVVPNRIDLMTHISGVAFEDAWNSRELGDIGGLLIPFISREMLKRNKAASGRTQDLADLEHL